MNRRDVLVGTAGLATLAGCSSGSGDGDPSGGEDTPTEAPDEPGTPTESPTDSPDPAEFEIESIDAPDSVGIGEEWSFSITIANTGEQDGTFRSEMSSKTSDTEWETSDEPWEVDIPAGGKQTLESTTGSIPFMTTVSYRIEETEEVFEINVVSRKLAFGEMYTNPDGITLCAVGVRFEDSYEWSSGSYDYVEEPSSGHKWAYVEFYAKNDSGSPEFAPSKRDISILADSSQYDYETSREDGNEYEGGEIQASIERDGWILYEVPDDLDADELRVSWSEDYYDGDVAAYWSENPDE